MRRMRLIPPKLAAGPIVSAAHPKPAIPAMDDAMPPVAKLVKTRPKRCVGVNSWSIVHTIGVNMAVLPPITAIRAPATTGASRKPSAATARPPTAKAPDMNRKRQDTSPCVIDVRPREASSIPTPSADHNHPS